MTVLVLANSAAGWFTASNHPDSIGTLSRAFADQGVHAEVRAVRANVLAATAKEATKSNWDAIVAAGGDGTVSTISGALAGGRTPLGILPLGTLNHFARDLGIPRDLAEAVKVIVAARSRRVDLGEVDGHTFVNNSSIGFYPTMVEERDFLRARFGRSKWVAMALAALHVFQRFPLLSVRLTSAGQTERQVTPFVFIGNNKYEISFFALGARRHLDRGEISLYMPIRCTSRWAILKMAFCALFGRLEPAQDFQLLSLTEVKIDTGKGRLRVALDGEVVYLKPPLIYRTRPKALTVLAPSPSLAPATEEGKF